MCGIFGYIGKKSTAAQIVFAGIKSLEYRGYDSWGVAVVPITNSKVVVKKRIGKIGTASVSDLPPGNIAIGHTRWATHGGVTEMNAHPHTDCLQSIALIHNGIIENYAQLKKELIKSNHKFISETDTEVATHLIEELSKTHEFALSVRMSFKQMTGLNAFIALNAHNQELIAIRNGSPLVIGFGEQENFIASDAPALLPLTHDVYFLKDDEMAVVTMSEVNIYDAANGKFKKIQPQRLDWKKTDASRGKFSYFMLKEIHEQPEIINTLVNQSSISTDQLADRIKKSYGTYLVGCGSSAYVSLAGTYLFSKIANKHINWAPASEFAYHLDFLTAKSLVIALSQSGETMDTLEAIKAAKNSGAQIGALLNVLGSTLYRESHYQLLIGAGIEKAVASTKAVTATLAQLVLLAYTLSDNKKIGQKILIQSVTSIQKLFNNVNNIKNIAHQLKNAHHIYIIGRGLSYPTALETALKIKEISYIHAEGFAAGELKHGVIALIEKGTPCIAYVPNDETYGANLAGAMEMKARGGNIIGISHKSHEIFDEYLEVQDAEEATIIPNIVVGQLLAYFLALEKNLDPDMPRNLAKSVTVK